MKSVDVTKENREVREYRQNYLAAGKHYSHLLSAASKLSPHILSIVKEIQKTGNNISALDSKVITDFYNDVLAKSKIDPAYHKLAQELVRAKHVLDHLRYQLFHKELNLALKKAGIPVKKHNLSLSELAEIVNNKNEKLLAKIAYSTPYIKEELMELSLLVERGEIELTPGEITGKSRVGRSFLKDLSRKICEKINNERFGKKEFDIKKVYVSARTSNLGPLELLGHIGDEEHIRELERRITSGDVLIKDNQVISITEKGLRYLKLLQEELDAVLEKRLDGTFLDKNRQAIQEEGILANISQIISDYEAKLAKHQQLIGRLDTTKSSLHNLVDNYGGNIMELVKSRDEIFSDIERISRAALSVRKKLLILGNLGEVKVEDTISLVSAYRLLTNYENQLGKKIESLSSKLNLGISFDNIIVPSITSIRENATCLDDFYQKAEDDLQKVIPSRVKLKDDLDNILTSFVKEMPEYDRYRDVVADINSLKDYLLDYLENEDRLYRGNEVISTIISEIIELEVEREELLSKIAHEAQLAHKQIWLTSIRQQNEDYFASNLTSDKNLNSKAVSLNAQIVTQIEKDIKGLLVDLKTGHEKHSVEFLSALKNLSNRVDSGEDISQISADLKKKYNHMDHYHKEILGKLEREMARLDRQLGELPTKSRKAIEKNLIFDIKNQVEK